MHFIESQFQSIVFTGTGLAIDNVTFCWTVVPEPSTKMAGFGARTVSVEQRAMTMQRQMNADEPEDFYKRVGAAIWHVQYLEDVLVSFLAIKIISPKRSAGQATAAEMDV